MNWLLYTRSGPFAPSSAWSISLGLDNGPIPIQSPLMASVGTTNPAQSALPASAPATSATPPAQATAPAATPIVYTSIAGADMPGSDMLVDVGGSKVSSQGTYGPTGCTAICSSNSGCAGSVYQPSTKTCWIKTGIDPKAVQTNNDRILQVPASKDAPGNDYFNTSFGGQTNLSLVLPDSDQCKSLCSILPWATCTGTTYDGTTKICTVLNPANGMKASPMITSFLR